MQSSRIPTTNNINRMYTSLRKGRSISYNILARLTLCNVRQAHVSGYEHKDNDSQSHSQSKYIESITKSHVAVALKDLENSLLKRYFRRYTRQQTRLVIAVLSTIGIGSFALYMFREPIKENLSDEVADVASRSLGDESLVLKANEITKLVINDIVKDENSQTIVANFVTDLLKKQVVKEAVIDLVQYVINNDHVQKELQELVKRQLSSLLKDSETRTLLLSYIKMLVLDEQTKNACHLLIKGLADDDVTRKILEEFLKDVLSSETVTNQAVSLGKDVTQSVLCDENIQKETGNALWNATIHSITPRWFS